MELQTARKRWSIQGTTGVLLIGGGLTIIVDAAYRRFSEEIAEIWWVEGTIGLVLFMTGLAFFGSAVRYLVHMDRIAEYSERKARRRSRHQSESRDRSRSEPISGDEIKLKSIKSVSY